MIAVRDILILCRAILVAIFFYHYSILKHSGRMQGGVRYTTINQNVKYAWR